MNFQESIATCFAKYATFSGKASRREFWWFILFCSLLAAIFCKKEAAEFVFLVTFVPVLAASSRRLHDIGRTSWWLLLYLLQLVGWVILFFWLTKPGLPDVQGKTVSHAEWK